MPGGSQENPAGRRGAARLAGNLLFGSVSAALLLGLALQVVLLICGSWEVPPFLLSRLHEELRERGWTATYSSLSYRPGGTVLVDDLRLTRLIDDEPVAQSASARLDFDWLKLLSGSLEIEEVSLTEAGLFCPARQSPTGVAEKVVTNLSFRAEHGTGGWEIRTLAGKKGNLTFSIEGALPRLARREAQPVDLNALLNDLLPRLVRDGVILERFERPHIQARIAPAPHGLTVHLEGRADLLRPIESVAIHQPQMNTEWKFDGESWRPGSTTVAAAGAVWNEQMVSTRRLSGRLFWPRRREKGFVLPNRAELAWAEVQTPAGLLANVLLTFRATEAESLAFEAFALLEDEPVSGSGQFDWRNGDGTAEVVVRANPTRVLQQDLVRQLGLEWDVFLHQSPYLRGSAEVRNWQLAGASGVAVARDAEVDGVFLDRASVRAELSPERFRVREMILGFGDSGATGSYEFDIDSETYRFLFRGGIQPLHISPWFDEWWVELWQEMDFGEGLLRGDVDIRGVLGKPEQVELHGSVGGEDFFVRGAPFRRLEADVHVLDRYVELRDIALQREEGEAAGWFRYWSDQGAAEMDRLDFEAEGIVNVPDLAGIFGPKGIEILAPFRFTEAPALRLAGSFFKGDRFDQTRVDIRAEAGAPLAYHGLPLDRLLFEAAVRGDEWSIGTLDAGIAGGRATGRARKSADAEAARLEFDLEMRRLQLKEAMAIAALWQERTGEPGEEEKKQATGLLDLEIRASGIHGDARSFEGDGRFRIREADLAEVHLFGLLSRMLSKTPFTFTSVQFSEADSRFRLEREKVRFDNLQLFGPSSVIRASGDYLMDRDELDFSVKLFLLKESRVPLLSLLLAPIVDSLAHVLEIRLTGPVGDPQWRFLLGPRNILGGISTGTEPREAPPAD